MGSLNSKTAFVTGASGGIGAATAKKLASAGARVALAARRTDRLDACVSEILNQGGDAVAVPMDITDRASVRAAMQSAVATLGLIDILVNNAGVMPLSPIVECRVEDWEQMLDVNVRGVLYCLAEVLPPMVERGTGHIVNIGSVAGRRPLPAGTVYAATKFAVRAISAGLQLELSATHGIRVSEVQPGVVDTELQDLIPHEPTREGFRTGWADKRPLSPDDVAEAVLYACCQPEHVNVNEILVRPRDQAT